MVDIEIFVNSAAMPSTQGVASTRLNLIAWQPNYLYVSLNSDDLNLLSVAHQQASAVDSSSCELIAGVKKSEV